MRTDQNFNEGKKANSLLLKLTLQTHPFPFTMKHEEPLSLAKSCLSAVYLILVAAATLCIFILCSWLVNPFSYLLIGRPIKSAVQCANHSDMSTLSKPSLHPHPHPVFWSKLTNGDYSRIGRLNTQLDSRALFSLQLCDLTNLPSTQLPNSKKVPQKGRNDSPSWNSLWTN